MQTTEFAVAKRIDYEPAFNWWVKHVLKKRDKIIARIRKQQTKILKRSKKFGIEIPKTVEEDFTLNVSNGNTLWADATSKEMEISYQMGREYP